MKNLIWLFVAPVLYVVSFLTSLVYVILHIISGPVTSSQGQEAMSGPHLPSHGVPQASASGKRSEQPPSLEVSSDDTENVELLNALLEKVRSPPVAERKCSEQASPEKGPTAQHGLLPHNTLKDMEDDSLVSDNTPPSKQQSQADPNTPKTPDPKTPEREEKPISKRLSYSPESPTDAEAMEQRDLDRDLEELLTPVELRDVEELLMPEIDGAAPEERLRRALEIVGVGLLSEAAEKHPEAAFTAWMGRKHKSHPYRSQVYREKLQLFDKNARFARMANEMWNADRSMGEDLCRFNDLEDADEIDLYEWSPGGIVDWDGTDDDDVPMYSGPSPFEAPHDDI